MNKVSSQSQRPFRHTHATPPFVAYLRIRGLQIAITEAQMRNGPVNDLDLLAFGQRRKGRKFKGGRIDGLVARAGTRQRPYSVSRGQFGNWVPSHMAARFTMLASPLPLPSLHTFSPTPDPATQTIRSLLSNCNLFHFFSSHFTRKPKTLRQKKPLASYLYPTMTGGQARGVQDVAVLLPGAQEEQKEGLD